MLNWLSPLLAVMALGLVALDLFHINLELWSSLPLAVAAAVGLISARRVTAGAVAAKTPQRPPSDRPSRRCAARPHCRERPCWPVWTGMAVALASAKAWPTGSASRATTSSARR